jgi:hypothetical protein
VLDLRPAFRPMMDGEKTEDRPLVVSWPAGGSARGREGPIPCGASDAEPRHRAIDRPGRRPCRCPSRPGWPTRRRGRSWWCGERSRGPHGRPSRREGSGRIAEVAPWLVKVRPALWKSESSRRTEDTQGRNCKRPRSDQEGHGHCLIPRPQYPALLRSHLGSWDPPHRTVVAKPGGGPGR